ncbi:zf-HC2 domain-containing protein [Streptomyces sp. ICN441]|uniref:anti-sigma factor family protein n=1 Tax=Streptomyces sp. ICN441 TaxID=2558286 RepID=UPI00106AF28B|nr:anti-sigma factor [Streptomyces sp. ICN441]TFE53812.1 zf-HC2 domain-containing protein [Streptomyces sp. ICN441]
MSGTIPTPAEQHLGDRLAALVDGELEHDARERVLAHLATCPRCKAEADAQRRLKSVFAAAAPPPPSEGLLARLQGLPAGPPGGDDDRRGGPLGRGRPGDGVFGVNANGFGFLPGGHGLAEGGPESGFRIHDAARHEAERSMWRGRRFAFAAASAVSFAAIALGGALPLAATGDASARGDNRGNNVTPLRTATSGAGADANRRRAGGVGVTGVSSTPVVAVAPHTLVRTRPPAHPFAASSLLHGGLTAQARPTASAFQLATAPGPGPSASPLPSRPDAPPRR